MPFNKFDEQNNMKFNKVNILKICNKISDVSSGITSDMDLEICVLIYNFLAAMKVLIKKSLCMPCLCVRLVHYVNVHVPIENIT